MALTIHYRQVKKLKLQEVLMKRLALMALLVLIALTGEGNRVAETDENNNTLTRSLAP